MSNYLKLKELSYAAAQGTFFMEHFDMEVVEREKDLVYVKQPLKPLLIGATSSEVVAWEHKFSEKPTAISLQDFKNPDIRVMDMHELTYADDSFGYVYCSNALEHSPAPILALMEIERVLTRGGRAFLWMPDDVENQKEQYHYSCFSSEIWTSLIEKAGLVVSEIFRNGNQVGYLCQK